MKYDVVMKEFEKSNHNCDNTQSNIKYLVKDKKVLYIATAKLDYLRVQQEINILEKNSSVLNIIVSNHKFYLIRLIVVYIKVLLFFKSKDVVFIGFSPQLVLPFLKWRLGKVLIVIDFFISLQDTFVSDRKIIKSTSIVSNILVFFDKLTLKWADLVICDTREHAKYFILQFECETEKINVLYLIADSKYYYPKVIEKPLSLRKKYIVLYFGTVLPLQGTDVIMDAINLCKNNKIFYIMIGPLDKTNCTNKNVKFIPWLSQEKLSDYIAVADLCLAGHFCANIAKASRTIPGKAYIYEAMNKKIILGENRANRERYPKHYSAVKFVKMGSPDELNKVIMRSYLEDKSEN